MNTSENIFDQRQREPADVVRARFSKYVLESGILASQDIDLLKRQVESAWTDGYCFGNNEVMDKWQRWMAVQPPPPIKIDANEMSIENYKGFLSRKINKDSKGNWWLKIKLWYKFIMA